MFLKGKVYGQKVVPNQVRVYKEVQVCILTTIECINKKLLSKPESGTVKCEQILLDISTFRDWKSDVVWLKVGAFQVCVLNGNLI